MAKAATKKPKIAREVADLSAAFEWCKIAQAETGPVYETHAYMGYGRVIAFNGIIAAGHLIADQNLAAPHTYRMLSALKRVQGGVSIAINDTGNVGLSAGKFRATIPCIPPDSLANIQPDPMLAPVTDEIKWAFNAVEPLAKEGAQTVHASAILVRANSFVATDGIQLFEYWHGCDMPTCVVPKAFAAHVGKLAKPLKGVGAGPTSLTLWFTDDSWLRTQCYLDKYPDIDRVTGCARGEFFTIPDGFFDAIEAVQDFSPDGGVHVQGGRLYSHDGVPDAGASYEVAMPDCSFNARRMLAMRWATHLAFDERREKLFAEGAGKPTRGLLSLIRSQRPPTQKSLPAPFPAPTIAPVDWQTGKPLAPHEAAAYAARVAADAEIPL